MGEIRERKSITKGSDLVDGFPDNFGKFFDYVRGLKHGEQPDYQRWKRMFHDLPEADVTLSRITSATALAFPQPVHG
jgi:hypothetical protein